jgi:uncharacterized protein (TIGR02145 family)
MQNLIFSIIFITFSFFLLTSCNEPLFIEQKEFQTSTLKDIDGKEYKTVKIGKQWWMQQDLASTSLKNNKPILAISDPIAWAKTSSPAYIKTKEGYLYNYYAVKVTDGLAPGGWHIATDEDWKILELEIGMSNSEVDKASWRGFFEGDKLKDDYQKGNWIPYEKVWGNNESGFTGTPNGCIIHDGRPCEPSSRSQAFWWTSTSNGAEGWYRNLDYKKSSIFRHHISPKYGMAVRCVKD